MTLLRDLQESALNEDVPLSQALRTALVLAQRLDYAPLGAWARRELDGYPEDAELPDYRAYRRCEVLGNFVGPAGMSMSHRPLPIGGVAEEHQHALFGYHLPQGVAYYEGLVAQGQESLQLPWSGSAVVHYQASFIEMMALTSAWRVASLSEIRVMLSAVRTRLLDFALEVERQAPDAGESPSGQAAIDHDRLNHVFVTVVGDHNVVAAAGRDASQSVSLSGAEWEQLATSLAQIGLAASDLEALHAALTADLVLNLPSGAMGPQTARWYAQIAGRVKSGAVVLSTEVGAAFIADAILRFLGAS